MSMHYFVVVHCSVVIPNDSCAVDPIRMTRAKNGTSYTSALEKTILAAGPDMVKTGSSSVIISILGKASVRNISKVNNSCGGIIMVDRTKPI